MISSSPTVDWLLESIELDASLFHVGRYCGGWHASTYGLARASFHLVVHGQCWLHIDGQSCPQPLSVGDAVFLVRDVKYRLSNEAILEQALHQPRTEMQPLDKTAKDGVGLVCGFFHFQSGLSTLIINALPDLIILRADDPSSSAARSLFALILEECQRLPAPSSTFLERLSHLLFLYVLRHQVVGNADLGGLVALARHPTFAQLLTQLIDHPEHGWTLESMAASVKLSRSAFFKRFNEMTGQSPGQVLLVLRMRHACQLLKTNNTVEQASVAVGYQSISAFTRAFNKVVGVQPGAYRKQHEGR
ncbi:AraC family transcriptional regulator [Pseudomonas sp. CCI3.2]|uniref:AraC family transcriptional regulator n=1 Tax=unclassified Pseudomonas TaxID=196821 RepID=UPI002AC8ECFA|nr:MULTISPECIES: AraC family transcriptional regulator [unclassified Pseudomonas]MEB0076116.1 AraC family transcriptional regulator [Pseudomonas sp. MH10out]MEB0100084.1 AraC family transcriptional regulator [Pseudomonas sp. CCI3.2]MEB0132071.1 AraC family transcriptional regulator [Pseudomonas sp. CCI2.4]MEB0156131.1 AraC family transcriptional regulator [Pseudomonas sp. AH2 (2023)]MEB0166222.1 AraC family transcriptional regulator [Pseudomonas sp. CCC4.4]